MQPLALNTCQEKFEDTKGIIRSCKSKKDRQYNGVKKNNDKRGNNDLQNTTQKRFKQRKPHQKLMKGKQFLLH